MDGEAPTWERNGLTTPGDVGSERPDDVDRADALERRSEQFAQGAPPVPRKAIVIAVVAFVVLGLGGALLDHFFGGPVNTSAAVTTGTDPPSLVTTPTDTSGSRTTGQLPASLPELLGLATMTGTAAPPFSLTAQDGETVSIDRLRGKVVILSFFDSKCDDICPVLAIELHEALDDLRKDASRVVVLTVNTDPVATSRRSANPAERAAGIGTASQWYFLSGTLQQLNAVWKAYAMSIEVDPTTDQVSHNNVLYFIDETGKLRLRATPFANESRDGTYTLASGTEQRFASGIASSARSLLGVT
jgi:cytochrome oxidase Cu insertion factor (SCO1/SenC/PrrC family)